MPSGFSYMGKKVVVFPACLDFCPLCSPDYIDVCKEVVFTKAVYTYICMFIRILALGTFAQRREITFGTACTWPRALHA